MFNAILDFAGGLLRNNHEKREAKRNRAFQVEMVKEINAFVLCCVFLPATNSRRVDFPPQN